MKATDKQLRFISKLEKQLGETFCGTSTEEASKYIELAIERIEQRKYLKRIDMTDGYPDEFAYEYYRETPNNKLHEIIHGIEEDLHIKFIGKTRKDAILFIVRYNRLKCSPDYTIASNK